MESLYSFFCNSTFRWGLLNDALNAEQLVLKRSTGTRWSAKFSSINALNGCIKEVKAVLLRLINDETLQTTPENKAHALGILRELCKFKNILMLKIWYAILIKFEHVNKMLQKSDLNLSVAVQLYQSLIKHCEDLKSRFAEFFDDARNVYTEIDAEQYVLKSRSAITIENMDEEKDNLESSIFQPIIDSLLTNLKTRLNCYIQIDENFSFLSKLNQLNCDQIKSACQRLTSFYTADFDENDLISECELAKQYFFTETDTYVPLSSIYSKIYKEDLLTIFPNIEIALRIFLTLFVTNVPDERAFSKLKYIKDVLRNSMTDTKLNWFSLMSIENEILHSLNMNEIIEEFILLKNRRMK